MRIWDIAPEKLCRQHLLGEHRELHAIWNILTKKKKGYSKHPETLRWMGKLKALYIRHEMQVLELKKRGYNHNSPLSKLLTKGANKQYLLIDSVRKQKQILKLKKCECKTS